MSTTPPNNPPTAPAVTTNGEEPPPTELKRAIGPGLLLLFIVGDILGTGVYSLTGKVAGEVGGAGWLPILIAFAVGAVAVAEAAFVAIGGMVLMVATVLLALAVTGGVVYVVGKTIGPEDH